MARHQPPPELRPVLEQQLRVLLCDLRDLACCNTEGARQKTEEIVRWVATVYRSFESPQN